MTLRQGRRPPPPVPSLARVTVEELARQLTSLWRWLHHLHTGLSAPHGYTHSVGGGDQLDTPGTPTAVGGTASVGSGPAYAYEDHAHDFNAAIGDNILANKVFGQKPSDIVIVNPLDASDIIKNQVFGA